MINPAVAAFAFLPVVRQGAAADIPDTMTFAAANPARARLAVRLSITVDDHAGAIDAAQNVVLLGPGDVTGIDQRQVLRTEPGHLIFDFEPFLFPFIEFHDPSLPWMFTPAAANPATHQLRPWICLVVVEKRTGVSLGWQPGQPLPVLTVDDAGKELPDLKDAFAWAHAQVVGGLNGVAQALTGSPERTLSRLVAARRLVAGTSYLACVVPTFEAGRQAGLGPLATMSDPTSAKLADAWSQSDQHRQLPVYYSWEFTTGPAGDFETLATRLEARPVPAEVGTQAMDLSQPGGGLAAVPGAVVGLEGALCPPGFQPATWPVDSATSQLQATLEQLVNAPETRTGTDPTPRFAPPIYGRWPAGKRTVPGPGGMPPWLRTLNLDPRHRAAAGFGTRIVQDEQEQLMASAWNQVGELERANQALRQAQLARSVGVAIHVGRLAGLSRAALLQLTAPTHARVVTTTVTVEQEVRDSRLPAAALSPAFRRIARPRGPLSRRLLPQPGSSWSERTGSPSLLERLNSGEISAAPPQRAPAGGIDVDGLLATLGGPPQARYARLTRPRVEAQAPPAGFSVILTEAPGEPQGFPVGVNFQQAAAEQQGYLMDLLHIPRPPDPGPLQLDRVVPTLLARLDPVTTVPANMRARVTRRAGGWQPADPLEPIMAAPEFSQAMYAPLRALSQDLLLPGLEHVPPNTVTVLETNRRFVEAYLVGLNHEMSRELLFREFPCDQRGTYFRQFWDGRTHFPPPLTDTQREQLRDIYPTDRWPATKQLGDDATPQPRDPSEPPWPKHLSSGLVLLVRGDLLRRYPQATVYAVKATGGVPSTIQADERYPTFQGTLTPDVTFLGFELTEQEARGAHPPDDGWFFVLKQHPTEPHFGLDEAAGYESAKPSDYRNLSWGTVATSQSPPNPSVPSPFAVDTMVYAPVLGSQPDNRNWTWSPPPPAGAPPGPPLTVAWGKNANAAQLAYITLQRPVRLAIHASVMLPPRRQP